MFFFKALNEIVITDQCGYPYIAVVLTKYTRFFLQETRL